ncbi:MAG: tetratricopeptide repeat protein, partial [Planctomycetota bacterium]
MGVVYKAFHPQLKRTVALKVLIAGEDATEEAIKRFHREAEAVAKLGHHPNIVPVYDIGQVTRESTVGAQHAAPLHYFAMHYVDGKPLDKMIDDGEITPKMAASIAKRVANGLAHAHSHGILHRDIKPANIMVDKVGEPQITDFGLAKDVDSKSKLTYSGATIGTPQYMPPEQADGRLKDIDAVLLIDPVSPGKKNPIVDKDLSTICLKCLEKEQDRRYANAEALAKDLESYLAGGAIAARPPSLRYRMMKKARRHKPLVWTAGVAVAVMTAGAIVAGLALRESERGKTEALTLAGEEAEQRRLEEKRRRSVEVVLAAQVRLGKIHEELRQSFFDDGKKLSGKRGLYGERKEEIDEFLAAYLSGGRDSAERATVLALKGWLLRFGGFRGEAMNCFARSREADPEADWGWFLEAMAWLSEYLEGQQLPPAILGGGTGIAFEPARPESERVIHARKALLDLLNDPVWDRLGRSWGLEKGSLDGLVKKEGVSEAHERSLSSLLNVPELIWVRSEILLARAKIRYALKDFDGAANDVDEIIPGQTMRASLYLLKGIILSGKAFSQFAHGRNANELLSRSIEEFGRALERNSDLVPAYTNRGLSHVMLGKAIAARGGDPREAYQSGLDDIGEALVRNPIDPLVYHNRGGAFWALGEAEAARGEDPRESYGQAIKDFSKAISIDSDCFEAILNRGCVLADFGKAEAKRGRDPREWNHKAVEDFSKALTMNPECAEAYCNRGVTHRSIGDAEDERGIDPRGSYRRSIDDLGEALARNPGFSVAYLNRGGAYRRLGKAEAARGGDPREEYRKAIADCDEALKGNPELAQAHNDKGLANYNLGKSKAKRGEDPRSEFNRALEECKRALDVNPHLASAYINRGLTHVSLGLADAVRGKDPRSHFRKAVLEYGQALAINPEDAATYNNRGIANQHLGDAEAWLKHDPQGWYTKAIADYDEALKRNPGNAGTYNNRGNAYKGLGV